MSEWLGYQKLQNSVKHRKTLSDSIKHYKVNLAGLGKGRQQKYFPEVVKTIIIKTAEKGVEPLDDLLELLDSDGSDDLAKLGYSLEFLNVSLDLYEADLVTTNNIMKKYSAQLINVTVDIDETLKNILEVRAIIKKES